MLTQDRHHDLRHDPHHEASSLPDLLGLRTLGVWTASLVREALPRVRREELPALAGLDGLEEAHDPLAQLADAAAASVGSPGLASDHPEVFEARRAAIGAGLRGADVSAVARALGLGRCAVNRLPTRPATPAQVRAVAFQLRLRKVRPVQRGAFAGTNDAAPPARPTPPAR